MNTETDLLRLRRYLVESDRPYPLEVLPTDLEGFNVEPWTGLMYGMRCVESPIHQGDT